MEQQDRLVYASEARDILKEEFGVEISHSKMTRLMKSGEIPPVQRSTIDARKQLVRLSDVRKWGEKAKQELGRAA